jgi:hypothetical protein
LAALSICQIKAPELAKAISDEQGIAVKRVSLKNRNSVMGLQTNGKPKFSTTLRLARLPVKTLQPWLTPK